MTDFKAIASSLEERGFRVIPEFLSRDEIPLHWRTKSKSADFPLSRSQSPVRRSGRTTSAEAASRRMKLIFVMRNGAFKPQGSSCPKSGFFKHT